MLHSYKVRAAFANFKVSKGKKKDIPETLIILASSGCRNRNVGICIILRGHLHVKLVWYCLHLACQGCTMSLCVPLWPTTQVIALS